VFELLTYDFMQRSLVAAAMVGGLCSLIGVFVVLRGLAFVGAGTAHAAFAGVAVLLLPNGRQHFGLLPCLAILAGATTWSLGSVLTRSMDLPKSRPLTAGAAMMLGGAALLAISAGFGEMHPFPHVSLRGGLALLYLIVFGSLLAFTAFVWLLAHMPATRVASHAYVNPIVAVALGYFAAGEVVTMRMLAGTVLVLTSVFLILRRDKLPA